MSNEVEINEAKARQYSRDTAQAFSNAGGAVVEAAPNTLDLAIDRLVGLNQSLMKINDRFRTTNDAILGKRGLNPEAQKDAKPPRETVTELLPLLFEAIDDLSFTIDRSGTQSQRFSGLIRQDRLVAGSNSS